MKTSSTVVVAFSLIMGFGTGPREWARVPVALAQASAPPLYARLGAPEPAAGSRCSYDVPVPSEVAQDCQAIVKLLDDRSTSFQHYTGDLKRRHHGDPIYFGTLTPVGFPDGECEKRDYNASADDTVYSCSVSFQADKSQASNLFRRMTEAANGALTGHWESWRSADGDRQIFRAGPDRTQFALEIELDNTNWFGGGDDWMVSLRVFSQTREDK